MSSVGIKTGREGPRHDPYGYQEISVKRPSGAVTIHRGLGDYAFTPEGRRVEGEQAASVFFEAVAGISPEQAIKAFNNFRGRRIRYHVCKDGTSHRAFHWVEGYPGEELLVCEHCGTIVDSEFDINAVI